MTPDELESIWLALSPPIAADGISGRRVSGLSKGQPAYLAVDGRGHRHLLIQVPECTAPVDQWETRSLVVTTARFQVGANPESLYVDLACTDSSQNPTFSAVVHDLIRSLMTSVGPPRDSILNALARWHAFWDAKRSGLSREDALGLFGELWFMRRWLGRIRSAIIQWWQATEASRHDFQWAAASVEVKTTANQVSGDPTHKIASLDQLADPERGQLYFFSLQVCDDAIANNTLHAIVERLAADLAGDFAGLTSLNEKLAARGYTPSDSEAAARPLRIVAERLYRVGAGFPRLIRSSFQPDGPPAGVVEITYSIDLAACRPWLIATAPDSVGVPQCFHGD